MLKLLRVVWMGTTVVAWSCVCYTAGYNNGEAKSTAKIEEDTRVFAEYSAKFRANSAGLRECQEKTDKFAELFQKLTLKFEKDCR